MYGDATTNKDFGKHWGPDDWDDWDWDPKDYDTRRYNRTSDKTVTGITVGTVTSSYKRGAETRPKNMRVIFIIRVW